MINALRAELRKLLTVRSTYVLLGLGVVFVLLFAGYIQGWRLKGAELLNPNLLSTDIVMAVNSLPLVFACLVAILLMTHEYRYNTIMYTLTLARTRSTVLASKIIVLTGLAVLYTLFIATLSPIASYIGIQLHGNELGPQTIYYQDLLWRCLFYGWGLVMLGLLLGVLIRNQIGAIVAVFVIPTFEGVMTLLLKDNVVYLPMTALGSVLMAPPGANISPPKAALIFLAYLVVGWVVAWVLFVRRDAN